MTRARTKNVVLYADDDADDRELMAEWLQPCRHLIELRLFNSGDALLEHLSELYYQDAEEPSLIVLDQNMPGRTGLQILESLRRDTRWAGLPAVLYTTSTMPHEVIAAERLNAGFITKPLNLTQRDIVLRQMLRFCEPALRERIQGFWSKGS
ncbi:response regulator [Flaviaesturariibacter amylovorans]|uniref:Response regulatory domain-containing protein n=1 Tax=Flaviaesturariibacter amylovorans TaxID=1084520 RepID=A0ABP8H5P9_9BACT